MSEINRRGRGDRRGREGGFTAKGAKGEDSFFGGVPERFAEGLCVRGRRGAHQRWAPALSSHHPRRGYWVAVAGVTPLHQVERET